MGIFWTTTTTGDRSSQAWLNSIRALCKDGFPDPSFRDFNSVGPVCSQEISISGSPFDEQYLTGKSLNQRTWPTSSDTCDLLWLAIN